MDNSKSLGKCLEDDNQYYHLLKISDNVKLDTLYSNVTNQKILIRKKHYENSCN